MPVSELPPPAGYRFNTGIGVLPQFRAGQPTIRDLPSGGPTVETPTANYPTSLPPTMNYSPAAPSNDWRGSATLGYPNHGLTTPLGTEQDWRTNAGGTDSGWRDNATHQGNPHQSIFAKLGGFLGDLFNTDSPSSTQPSDTPPGMPQDQGLGAGGIPLKTWQQVFNTGRFTNAPAFAPTLAQAMFPGSRIGPGGSSVANPYDPNAPRGPMSHSTGLSGTAAAFHNYVAGRNIA